MGRTGLAHHQECARQLFVKPCSLVHETDTPVHRRCAEMSEIMGPSPYPSSSHLMSPVGGWGQSKGQHVRQTSFLWAALPEPESLDQIPTEVPE